METRPSELRPSGGHLRERIFALVDHELSEAEEATALGHIASCEECAAEHRKVERTVGLVAGLGKARAPMGFAARVMKRVRMQRRTNGLRIRPEQKVPYEGVIVIVLAAAVAALLIVMTAQRGEAIIAQIPASASVPHR